MKLRTFAIVFTFALVAVVGAVAGSWIFIGQSLKSASTVMLQTAESIYLSQQLRLEIIKLTLEKLDSQETTERLDTLKSLARQAEQHVTSQPEDEIVAALHQELMDLSLEHSQNQNPDLTVARRLAFSLVAINRDQAEHVRDEIADKLRFGKFIAVGAITFVVLLSAALVVSVRRFLLTPLAQLQGAVNDFAHNRPMTLNTKHVIREVQDVSESVTSMAENIHRNQQRQVEFVAGVAHDIRNPLNCLAMSIRLLAKGQPDSQPELARICTEQIHHLNVLLEDLMDRSRIQSGTVQLNLEVHDINNIVQEVFELHKGSSPQHRFVLLSAPGALYARCDRHRMHQVLHNLLSNAVKYSPEGGDITISVRRANGVVEICIADLGLGIRSDEIELVFEPFKRSSLTTRIKGVGLGLCVSKKIVEQHQGRIAVKSEVGRGSEFRIEIPMLAEESFGGAGHNETHPMHRRVIEP